MARQPRRAPPVERRWRRSTRVAVIAARGPGDVGRSDEPAHPPACHRVGLGHPIDDDTAIGNTWSNHRQRMKLDICRHEMLVDLIGHHPDAVFGRPNCPDGCDLVGGWRRRRWDWRETRRQRLGARWYERPPECSTVTTKPGASSVGNRDRDCAGQPDGLGYVTQHGAGSRTSSPGSTRAWHVRYTACLPPLVITTWAGSIE